MNNAKQSMKQIFRLDQSQKRQSLVKPTPMFQDTFVCSIGEHRCPVKKQNTEQALQLENKDAEIHSIQTQFENLKRQIGDVAVDKLDKKEVKKLHTSILESESYTKKDFKIQSLLSDLQSIKNTLEERDKLINDLQDEQQEYQQTVLEADLHQREKLTQYKQLTKRCNELTVKITEKDKIEQRLDHSIHEKKIYDVELTKAINEKVDVIKDYDKVIAKKRIEHQTYKKVEHTSTQPEKNEKIINIKIPRIFKFLKKRGKNNFKEY